MRISRLVETVKQMQRASRNFGFQVQHGTIRRRKGIRKLLRLAYSTLSLDISIYMVFRTLRIFSDTCKFFLSNLELLFP